MKTTHWLLLLLPGNTIQLEGTGLTHVISGITPSRGATPIISSLSKAHSTRLDRRRRECTNMRSTILYSSVDWARPRAAYNAYCKQCTRSGHYITMELLWSVWQAGGRRGILVQRVSVELRGVEWSVACRRVEFESERHADAHQVLNDWAVQFSYIRTRSYCNLQYWALYEVDMSVLYVFTIYTF